MANKAHQSLHWAHPLISEWFTSHVGTPTEPQQQGWPHILAGKSTLISAPTGSGKTLTAFMACLDNLISTAIAGDLKDETQVLYISPLKALGNDIQKNLLKPLEEITVLASAQQISLPEIRVAVRSGDTPMRERQTMLKKPPHILVTTPESLYILLTADKSREMLKTVKTVIVDEIHAMADDKRGSHLTLSLERLELLVGKPLQRIGLSATQKPIEIMARYLTGNGRAAAEIVDIGHRRALDLAIEVPSSELGAVASNEMWDEIYDRVADLSKNNRSTLVFVNTRRLAERVAHHLTERLGADKVAAHHGSLSRKLRHDAETRLKNGELQILVATASLELGIDIGDIDLVCQIGSPRAIAIALQRVGRAGHWYGATSKGRFFVTTRDELIEFAALTYAIGIGDLDQLIIPHEPIDILAQQIVATCVAGSMQEDALFKLVKRAYPYENLSRETFNRVIEMLSDGIAGSRGRYSAYLFRDQVNKSVSARRNARLTAITSGGAIPENGLYTVLTQPDGAMVGTLDEDFAVESNRGDIILLGTTSWMIKRIESNTGRVLVENAHGAPPSVPFWRGEAPGRTDELSSHVALIRQRISDLLPEDADPQVAIDWLKQHCFMTESAGEQFVEYLKEGRAILGAVPTQQTIIAERFFDESGGMQLIIHSPYGARINKAWGLALRKKFCRSFNFELQASATDNGINIALAEQHSFPLGDVFKFLHPKTIKDVLIQAILQSPLFATRWRWAASRSLALVRFRGGKKVPPQIQRMLSDDLLAAVFPDAAACQDNLGGRDVELPDHPLINEAMKDALHEALDVDGLTALLTDIQEGRVTCLAVDTPVPSTFSHEILNANPYAFLDDAPLEERRARAVEMRRVLPEAMLKEVGKLDPQAITEVQHQAWPDIRNADELHDMLQTLIAFPPNLDLNDNRHVPALWHEYFNELVLTGRAAVTTINENTFWVCAEKAAYVFAIYPNAQFTPALIDLGITVLSREFAIEQMLVGWVMHLGPTSNEELQPILQLSQRDLEQALLKLESTGLILRGNYRTYSTEWCERRLLARIHRATVGKLRREIAAVTAAQFMQWLCQWQHVAKDSQLSGERGLLRILEQLQGFEIPASAWESHVLRKRVKDYTSDMLDQLCLSGVVGWGRLSVHPSTEGISVDEVPTKKKRIKPSSIAPITFFVREDSDWIPHTNRFEDEKSLENLSHVAKLIHQYLKLRGASFFNDIVRGTGRLKIEVETGLWELVTAGIITADGFDNLRGLIDPRRRSVNKRGRMKVRFTTGRWSLLYIHEPVAEVSQLEAACRMLLKRYGVVFRDLVQREKNLPSWRDLLVVFRRLEDRGDVRGGRFVDGFYGEQFALPYAVDSIRALRKQPPKTEIIELSAADPLNLIGMILPGSKVSAISGKGVILKDGQQIHAEDDIIIDT